MSVLEKHVFARAKRTVEDHLQEALFDPAALLNSIADTSPSGILILQGCGEILLWNESATKIFGYSAEEAIGRNIHELVLHPDDLNRLGDKIASWNFTGSRVNRSVRELTVRSKDNRQLEIELTYVPFRSKDQTYAFCSIRDITVRKQNEAALRRSEECFHTIFHTYPDPCVIIRQSDEITVDVSERLETVTGYTRDEIVGKRIDETNLWETKHDLDLCWSLLYTQGSVNCLESHFRMKDGTLRTGQLFARAIMLESGPHIFCAVRDITDQKLADTQLRQSEERFRLIFQTSPDAVSLSQIDDGMFVDVNDRLVELTGYQREELIGHRAEDLRLWENEADRKRLITILREKGVCHNFAAKFRGRDGSLRSVLLSARILQLDNGPHILAFLRDVTEHEESQEALRQSEDRFRLIFQTTPDALCLTRMADGMFVDVNDRTLEISGYTRDEIIGSTSLDLFAWADLSERERVFSLLKERGVCHDFHSRFRTKDGRLRDVQLSARVITINNIPHVITFFRDVTEKRHDELALLQSEERFRTIFHTSPDSFTISRLEDGVLEDVNEGFTSLTGYTREEAIGQMAQTLGLWETAEERERLVRVVKEHGECRNLEMRIRLKNGEIRTALASARILAITDVPCIVLYIRDISSQKGVENELRESRKQLRLLSQHNEQVREEERKWVAREVHDELGQVLTAMSMNVAWMKSRLHDDQKPIANKAAELQDFIESAMDSIHKISARLRPVPLKEMGFEAAWEWLTEEFSARTGITCTSHYHVAENLLDPDRCTALFRILQEALNNVARHAQASHVSVNLSQRKQLVVLTVKDNGIGISSSQIKTMKSFGLAGMRERAEFYGGHVVIGSHSGQGTTVNAEIPIGD